MSVDWTFSTFPTSSTSKPMFHQEINDLRNPGFGLWVALSSIKGKRTGSRAWAHWKGEASCWVNFETRLANEPLLRPVMLPRTKNSWPPPRKEMNWVLKVSPRVTSEGFLHSRSVTHEFGKMRKTLSRKLSRKHSSTCRSSKGNPPSPHG